jgi:hypothetical protein
METTMITLTIAGMLLGCETKLYDDTGVIRIDDTSDTTDTTDTDDTDDTGDGVSPVVEGGTIECQSSDDDSPFNLYYFDADVIDPQGSSNVATIGSKFYAYDESGSLIFSDDIVVCSGGNCFGSFREDKYDDLDCDDISDQKFTVEIFDEDGNSSGEAKLTALVPEA